MHTLNDLRKFVREALVLLAREKDLASYEVYCSTGEHKVVRLNYTSDIPSRGIEEFKSLDANGFALRILTRRDPHEIGSASVAGDLSVAAVREALSRARNALIIDPHFRDFPPNLAGPTDGHLQVPNTRTCCAPGTQCSPQRRGRQLEGRFASSAIEHRSSLLILGSCSVETCP